ncbi:MAG: RNA polymerase sigma factor [Acidimicrobiales bacterium]
MSERGDMASVKEPLSRARHDDVDLQRDRSLVERCQAGDERAFEDLYLRYRDRLYRSCLRRVGNSSEAEDLVQETFARAWKALPRFNGERRFYPWLTVIANNLCTDLARRGGRCTPVEEAHLDLIAPAVDSEQESLIDSAGEGQILAAALGRISARHREVLELREGRNWSYQQIAAHEGVEVSTIETLLFRARRSLKREFMTISRAETGLAGVLALPLVALRGLLRRLGHLTRQSALGARLAATASSIPAAPLLGGAAVVVSAAAITAGAVLGAHPHTVPTSAVTRSHRPAADKRAAFHTGSADGVGLASGFFAAERPRELGTAEAQRAGQPVRSHTARARVALPGAVRGGGSTLGGGLRTTPVPKSLSGPGSTVDKVVASTTGSNPVAGVSSGVSAGVSGVTATVPGVSTGISGVTSTLPGVSTGVSSVGVGTGLP